MRTLLLSIIFLGATAICCAQNYNQDHTIKLWDNTSAPHSNYLTVEEQEQETHRLAYTSEAVLYIFRAEGDKATGQAVVICPGGGYFRLAMDHEGFEMAKWLAESGITAAVLKYRMPNSHPEVPLEDAVKALDTMKERASEWGFDSERVGIMGCSAGGHLAAMTSTMGATRPAFSVLFYPVITGEEGLCHKGSFDNLLGEGRSAELTAHYSLERRVDALTPPAILLLSDDDKSVPSISSTRYYNALKGLGIEASMHIYPSGGHGWGIRESFKYREAWQSALLDWLKLR